MSRAGGQRLLPGAFATTHGWQVLSEGDATEYRVIPDIRAKGWLDGVEIERQSQRKSRALCRTGNAASTDVGGGWIGCCRRLRRGVVYRGDQALPRRALPRPLSPHGQVPVTETGVEIGEWEGEGAINAQGELFEAGLPGAVVRTKGEGQGGDAVGAGDGERFGCRR
ncbi:MAG: hypothetical protein AAFP67_12370 [Pseudomonadota bacterium]